jgi:hypothetical protein
MAAHKTNHINNCCYQIIIKLHKLLQHLPSSNTMVTNSIASLLLPHTHTDPDIPSIRHPEDPESPHTNNVHHTSRPFRHIGHGFCGSVWAVDRPGNACAIKREDGGEGRSVLKDFVMHQKILAVMQDLKSRSPQTLAITSNIAVPACHQLVRQDDSTWWSDRLKRFPSQFQIPCNVLISDRIPPFSQETRETLIDRYCPAQTRQSAKLHEANSDCLVRAYLGRRRRIERQSRFHAFSLRNYPLHVDQMEDLGLDRDSYAKVMADTLAIMH